MGDLPLRTPTHRRFGGPLPRQLPNGTHRHPAPINLSPYSHAATRRHPVLNLLSQDYPGARGRSGTRYSPVRRSPAQVASHLPDAPRLACVKPVASVHPEPGSNSTLYSILVSFLVPSNGNRSPPAHILRRRNRKHDFNALTDCLFFLSVWKFLQRSLVAPPGCPGLASAKVRTSTLPTKLFHNFFPKKLASRGSNSEQIH